MRSFPLLLGVTSLSLVSCVLDDSVPPGAVVYCSTDDECPSEQRCDVAAHVCAAPGDDVGGPRVTGAAFAPASVRDGPVTLLLDVDEPIAAEPAPVLTFASPVVDPGFAPAGDAELVLADAASLAEGFYPLVSVTVADAAGNVATSAVDATLKVDRTAPLVDGLVVSVDGGGEVAADREGDDAFTVQFRVSEPVSVDVTAGTQPLECSASASALAFTCAGAVAPGGDGALQNGSNAVLVVVRDDAGNETSAQGALDVDLDAPAIVAGSVQLAVDGDEQRAFATVGETVTLRFLVDELLGADPVVALSGGEGIDFTVTSSSGELYELSATIDELAQGAPAEREIVATLADAFGHAATVTVPLPAPHVDDRLRVVAVPESPCTVPPRPDGSTCTDFDGDGFFGASSACAPAALDCDDDDPSVHPGAIEIAGDDVANDCDAAAVDSDGLSIFEINAVFVDGATGSDAANDGGPTEPKRTLAAARVLAGGTRPIVMTSGVFTSDVADLPTSLYGGRVLGTWERAPGATSSVGHEGGVCGSNIELGGDVFEGVTLRESPSFDGGVVRDVVHSGCSSLVRGASTIIDSHMRNLLILDTAPGTRVLGHREVATLDAVVVRAANVSFARLSMTGGAFVESGADAVFVNAVLRAPAGAYWGTCADCGRLSVFHSNIVGTTAIGAVEVADSANSEVVLVGNQFVLGVTSRLLDMRDPTSVTLVSNVIDQPSGQIIHLDDVFERGGQDGLDDLELCTYPGCVFTSGNVLADVALLADLITIDENAGTSAARLNVGDATSFGAPTFIAGDIFGTCRGTPQYTSGPLELD